LWLGGERGPASGGGGCKPRGNLRPGSSGGYRISKKNKQKRREGKDRGKYHKMWTNRRAKSLVLTPGSGGKLSQGSFTRNCGRLVEQEGFTGGGAGGKTNGQCVLWWTRSLKVTQKKGVRQREVAGCEKKNVKWREILMEISITRNGVEMSIAHYRNRR